MLILFGVLQVTFVGEPAIDHGGPRREFFDLFSLQCCETFFRGTAKYFDVNAAAVQVKTKIYLCYHTVFTFTLLFRIMSSFEWDS